MKTTGLGLFLMAAVALQPAAASPITYFASGIGSGSLGASSFTSSLITLTFAGDTTNITSPNPGIFTNAVGSLVVNIASLGSATFTDVVQAVDNQTFTVAGFGDNTIGAFILGTTDSAFATYSLAGAIGPITNTQAFNSGTGFETDHGFFVISSMNRTTFSASAGSATPEPSTISSMGLALVAAAGLLRRRARRA